MGIDIEIARRGAAPGFPGFGSRGRGVSTMRQDCPRRTRLQRAGLWLGPVLAAFIAFGFHSGDVRVTLTAAVVALMAVWWISEAVPLAVTSLLPFVLFPPMDILSPARVAGNYMNPIIFLFIGGFLIALAMERWNLHRRIALTVIDAIGGRPDTLVLGFMIASALLSMWISNTATAAMMLPIGLAIIGKVEETFGQVAGHPLALSLMLGIAYGCTIGGLTTLVGTATNLAFVSIFAGTFPEAPAISFAQWILFAAPFAAVFLLITWWMLTRVFCRVSNTLTLDPDVVRQELKALGPMKYEEKVVLGVFVATALLWIFRSDIPLGNVAIPGWSRIWEPLTRVQDGMVAIAMALLLFLLTGSGINRGRPLLDPGVFRRIPWEIILLFGGGFALADGFGASGLSAQLVAGFARFGDLNPLLMLLVICCGMTFLTEFTSNTATAQMLLPILAALGVAREIDPLVLMIPATMSASMAFMLPVATPPNAIIFGSGRIRIAEMARIGMLLNLIGVVLIALASYVLLPKIFGVDFAVFPEWAR